MDVAHTIEEPADKLGMTDAQWEIFQKATRGFGDQDENGIDLSLLRENLKLTPSQRLDKLHQAVNFFRTLPQNAVRGHEHNDGPTTIS